MQKGLDPLRDFILCCKNCEVIHTILLLANTSALILYLVSSKTKINFAIRCKKPLFFNIPGSSKKSSNYLWSSAEWRNHLLHVYYSIAALIRESSKIWHASSGSFVHPGQKWVCMNNVYMHDKSSGWFSFNELLHSIHVVLRISLMLTEGIYCTSGAYTVAMVMWSATGQR